MWNSRAHNLLNLMTADTTLLTPNRRLAATLLSEFNQLQMSQGKTSWQTPPILPLPSWLQQLWNEWTAKEITETALLLSPNQKSILWETVIRQSPLSDALLQISETAKLAGAAYELLQLWEVHIDDPIFSATEDSQAFQEWAKQFKKICRKNNWIDDSQLASILEKNVASKKIKSPEKIILAGFTEIVPQHLRLLHAFEQSGTELIHYHNHVSAPFAKKINLVNEETEIETMARWAKATYEAAPNKKPYLIGCVVPKLETLRESVLRIFSDVFSENNTFTLDHTSLPFNISAGKNLLSFPIVKTAIELLKLGKNNIDLTVISQILKSPFLGEAEKERVKRSHFENRLKRENITSLSMKKLISHHSSCSYFVKRIQQYLDYFSQLKKTYSMSEWMTHFVELLTLLGWPGERSLNSQEYQITQRWLDLLLECNSLDTVLEPQRFTQAIEWLTRLSAKTIFQPQSPEAPIQILGVLEAIELPFEKIWVMGLDDTNWPAAPRPNPFIPTSLQKMLNMPHATSERELIYCEQLIKQLKQSTQHIIFSYPEKNEEVRLRPSVLLNDIELTSLAELSLSDFVSPAQKIFATHQLDYFTDEMAPPIQTSENILGGTHIFKQQAACPFKAFSELRLHARSIETPTIGLRAIDRGNIVHTALELIWKTIQHSTTLLTLPENELRKIIRTCSEQAIASMIDSSQQRYFSLELERLEKILFDWLTLESERPGFKIAFQEHEINTTIGPIPITFRIDRIDELQDGTWLIIDYKTGKNNKIKNWFGERPDEPQLPLYCLVSGENIAGIAFGKIHPDEMTLEGISRDNMNIKSIKTISEWKNQLHEWKVTLEKLGDDFLNGIAHVDPKEINTTCNHCHLHTFCRIHEK